MAKIGVIDVGGGLRGIYAAACLTGVWKTMYSLIMASAFRLAVQTSHPI